MLPPGVDLEALNDELKRQRDAKAAAVSAITKTGGQAAKPSTRSAWVPIPRWETTSQNRSERRAAKRRAKARRRRR